MVYISSPVLDALTPAVAKVCNLRVVHRVLLQLAAAPTVVATIRNGHRRSSYPSQQKCTDVDPSPDVTAEGLFHSNDPAGLLHQNVDIWKRAMEDPVSHALVDVHSLHP